MEENVPGSSKPAGNGASHGGFWHWLTESLGGHSGTTKTNANCSFCRRSYRDVGPLVEGPGSVYICGECIELCQSILEQERRRRAGKPMHDDGGSQSTPGH